MQALTPEQSAKLAALKDKITKPVIHTQYYGRALRQPTGKTAAIELFVADLKRDNPRLFGYSKHYNEKDVEEYNNCFKVIDEVHYDNEMTVDKFQNYVLDINERNKT